MTELIIIDGVDVSEYTLKEIEYKLSHTTKNKIIESCLEIVKQLQRKTAECEELKEEKQDYCLNCDVAERMRKVVHAATGGRLSYANYTVDAIEQAYHDQLEIDVEYRTKILKEENTNLQHKLRIVTEALKDVINSETTNYDVLFWICKHALERIESEKQ